MPVERGLVEAEPEIAQAHVGEHIAAEYNLHRKRQKDVLQVAQAEVSAY